MKKSILILLITFGLLLSSCKSKSSENQNDATIQSESLENIGSDTMVNLALGWAEAYQTIHPEVLISVTGGGSGTGIASLINGTADIANASRSIKDEEIETAKTNDIKPVEIIVARDAIAVIVNPQNPISQLSLEQVSDIYSGKINNWAELGGEDRPIVRLSRETNSGTHVYFLEEVLRLGDSENTILFSRDTLLLPSSEGITTEVRDNPNAIGYDGLGYVTPDVKVIAISDVGSTNYVFPSYETVDDNSYPIARDLYMYTAGEPQGNIKQYLGWILSEEAQKIVLDLGFIPVQ